MKGAIYLRFQHDEFTQADRVKKIQMIHRCCDHLAMAMPVRGDRAGDIDEVHHAPAQDVPQKICVLRKHQPDHFGARSTDRPARQRVPGANLR